MRFHVPFHLIIKNIIYYIIISNCTGDCIINSTQFISEGANNTTRFIIITNLTSHSGYLSGSLSVTNNTQLTSPYTLRHLILIEEFIGNNFKLFVNYNTTIYEGNAPILFSAPNNDIFEFIELIGNSIQNTAGKGFIGVYTEPGPSTGTTVLYAEDNTIANQSFRTGWTTATAIGTPFLDTLLAGYDNVGITNPEYTFPSCYWSFTGDVLKAGVIASADFYANTSSSIAGNSDINFPNDGPIIGTSILRNSPSLSSFKLTNVGTYQVLFQVSVTGPAQLVLTLDNTPLTYTVVGTSVGSSQITGMALITTTNPGSILTVRNNSSTEITIPANTGFTSHIIITQIS